MIIVIDPKFESLDIMYSNEEDFTVENIERLNMLLSDAIDEVIKIFYKNNKKFNQHTHGD